VKLEFLQIWTEIEIALLDSDETSPAVVNVGPAHESFRMTSDRLYIYIYTVYSRVNIGNRFTKTGEFDKQ